MSKPTALQILTTLLLFTTTTLAKKTTIKKQKPQPSFISKLLPIIALLVVVGILAAIGIVVLQTVQSVQGNVQSQLDKNHIKISKDGAQVAYEGMSYEEYRDKTQGVFVNAWNNSEMLGFKSRIWGPKVDKKTGKKKT